MYDHIGLTVKDVEASVRFYKPALAALGHELCSSDDSSASFGPRGEPALYPRQGCGRPRRARCAPRARPRRRRPLLHAAGLKAGGRDNGRPGLRADYGPTYYAAFLFDPDGNNVEAVCLR